MADNVGYTPGAGAVVAADEIAGVLHQRVKLGVGADGVAVDVSTANPMPVTGTVTANTGLSQPLTDAQLRATAVPVSGTVTANTGLSQPLTDAQLRATPLPLPSGASTETTLLAVEVDTSAIATSTSAINSKLPALSTRVVDNEAPGLPVRAIGQEIWNVSFSEVGASVISDQFQTPTTGTGVSFSQASGALSVVAGTTANSEFFTRSTTSWRGAMRLKFSVVSSQRIANNNWAVMLADLIGEGLAVTINSATSITVAQSGHLFTATSVGQFVQVGRIVGAVGVPGRYAIASVVAGVSYNITVAGWPASGSCTATVFGHSYVRNLFTGATATVFNLDAQRRGWAQGDSVPAINTTASPGTVVSSELTGREVFWSDQLRSSSLAPTTVTRGSRIENIPDDNLELYLFVWSFNGTTAPASSTTWTISFCAIEKFANFPVYIQGNRSQGAANPIPTSLQSGIPAGSAIIGDVGLQYRGSSTGAGAGAHIVSAASTNATIVKAAGGRVMGCFLANTTASWRFVKLHNQATLPAAGVGVVRTIAVPPNGLSIFSFEGGIGFSTGIGLTIVTGSPDADTTPVGVGDIVGELIFA